MGSSPTGWTIPYMNYINDCHKLSEDELYANLITCDYKGKDFKRAALEELIKREIKENNHCLIQECAILRGKVRAANENVALASMTESFAIKQMKEVKGNLAELTKSVSQIHKLSQ